MKKKLKQFFASFILMVLLTEINIYLSVFWDFAIFSPQIGVFYVVGVLFGPYGILGAVASNIILDVVNGFAPYAVIPSAILSFGVSYLAYKLWYSGFGGHELSKPKLDNMYHLFLFLASIIICGLIFSAAHGAVLELLFESMTGRYISAEYLMNFINVAFIFGIIAIWASKRIDFVETPKVSKRHANKKLYRILFICLIITTLVVMTSIYHELGSKVLLAELIVLVILLFAYLTKPIESKVKKSNSEVTILEKIITIFLITTLIIAILGVIISFIGYSNAVIDVNYIEIYLPTEPLLVITDCIIFLFFIPGFIIMRYVETRVIQPIVSFSEIEKFIKENEKIEAEGLVNVYSKYIGEQDEIGKLARSYTDLIKHNNNYISNIHEIEGEKKRIEAELDIATRIQAANLPIEPIETDEYTVNGYSHPAKEVGGDFFDYYPIDEDNLAIVIGDASGKGVPAALLATITQVMIKQILKHEMDPSEVLYLLNNQICENNSETMFITLWLGIYNPAKKRIIYSNAGHNPPLIKDNGEFKYLDIDSGIVLGIMEDFEFVKEEIDLPEELIIYTDGITDANNTKNEMYGENRLLNFFNGFKSDNDPIKPLLDEIDRFTEDAEQFDDMTLVYLKDKQ